MEAPVPLHSSQDLKQEGQGSKVDQFFIKTLEELTAQKPSRLSPSDQFLRGQTEEATDGVFLGLGQVEKFYSPPLIGFAGRKGVGKDTAAEYFHAAAQYEQAAFADPLKLGLAKMFDIPLPQFYNTQYKELILPEFGFSIRQLMQFVGTEGVRALNKDAWLILMDKKLKKNPSIRYCISDLRMENEAEFVRSRGGIVVHILRGDFGPSKEAHSTEAGLEVRPCDLVLHNKGTLEEFKDSLYRLGKKLGW